MTVEAELDIGALQDAIFNSACFCCIATDEKGAIRMLSAGAERMLGYAAAELRGKTLAELCDPQELIARAAAMSLELGTPVAPGFEALVCKAPLGGEDIYALTYVRKDGSRLPATPKHTLALIMLDLQMNDMDGWQFLEQLHESGTQSSVPVILATGRPVEDSQAESRGAGAVLRKPIGRAHLKAALSKLGLLKFRGGFSG